MRKNRCFPDWVIGWIKCAVYLWVCVERVTMKLGLYKLENGHEEPDIQKWWKIHLMMENTFSAELAILHNLAQDKTPMTGHPKCRNA